MTSVFSHCLTADWIVQSLKSGSELQALLCLSVISSLTVILTTLIQNAYCISVGYGAAVMVMALCMLEAFQVPLLRMWSNNGPPPPPPQQLLALGAFGYGLRLCLFLLVREHSVPRMRDQFKSGFSSQPATKVLPLAAFLGVLYATMVSPVLFALRGSEGEASSYDERNNSNNNTLLLLLWIGVLMAFSGFVLEAVADQHKYMVKRQHKIAYGDKKFLGPTTYSFSWCRHPNYLGEELFWTGLWIAGIPFYHTSVFMWSVATLGWIAISNIMKGSAKRLDKKQQDWYAGQPKYEQWKGNVKGSLIPKLFL